LTTQKSKNAAGKSSPSLRGTRKKRGHTLYLKPWEKGALVWAPPYFLTRFELVFHNGSQVLPSSAEYSTADVMVCPSEEKVVMDFVL